MQHAQELVEERYQFKSPLKNKILILSGVGLILLIIGIFLAQTGNSHVVEGHSNLNIHSSLVASNASTATTSEGHVTSHDGMATWLKRLITSLWMNNVFFAGLGLIGLLFIAIQYAAQAGWSAGINRIPLAMGHWIPIAGVLMLVFWFLGHHQLFHWTHSGLYDKTSAEYDKIIDDKSVYFFWPLKGGSVPVFFLARMVLFFGLWYMFFKYIKREMLAEDLDKNLSHWHTIRKLSAIFIVVFGYSSSIAAWDWVMSIDTHWYSTMMGWYVFASWWVTGLSVITLIVIYLKEEGYLGIVNENHLHDLGKFIFAFSIFWTYLWFSQFMLIHYANIPEETVYFLQRKQMAPYNWIFYAILILNFFLPLLLFMTRDAKRKMAMLKLVCPIIIVGHWLDYFNLITPGVMKWQGGLGLLEIGVTMIFLAVFLWVTLSSLSKFPLFAKNNPMLQESLEHNI